MATGTLSIIARVGGISIQNTITEQGDHPNVYGDGNTHIALAAGKAVTDWVKTDADTAACNLPSGHGYSSGKMDVFWTGGCRYDVDGTVAGDALTLDGGVGDDFPASASPDVVVCTPQQINAAIDGDNCQLFVANSTSRAHLYFEDTDGDGIAAIEMVANSPYTWNQGSGQANPLSGDPITVCWASNGSTVAGVLTILSLEDSTP